MPRKLKMSTGESVRAVRTFSFDQLPTSQVLRIIATMASDAAEAEEFAGQLRESIDAAPGRAEMLEEQLASHVQHARALRGEIGQLMSLLALAERAASQPVESLPSPPALMGRAAC
jgi:hypothetical protein